ncbi:MAG: amino acid permease, partial [Gammaproteobacteria bacterium]
MTSRSQPGDHTIGIWTCVALVMGNMIGSGIFLLPAALASYGSISLVGWVFTSAGALVLALMFSRLSREMPANGGPYAYSRAGLGEFAGFWVAWGYWISLLCGNAAIAVAMVGYLAVVVPGFSAEGLGGAIAALAAIWILTVVNASGVRSAGRVQILTTVLKLLPLIAITGAGLFYIDTSNFQVANASDESTFSAISATATLTLWAFLGLESATVPAGNVSSARETIPRATVIGTASVAVIYIASTVAIMGLMPMHELASSQAPFADAAMLMWGDWAAYAVAIGAAISCFGALNGWILLTAKVPMAAAQDRLFPDVFGRVSKSGMPVTGLIISGVLATALVATNYTRGLVGLFTFAILLSTLTVLVPYAFSAAAELWLLRRERAKTGVSQRGAVIIAVLAFIYSFWAMAGSGEEVVYYGFLLLVSGVPVYVWLRSTQDADDGLNDSRVA